MHVTVVLLADVEDGEQELHHVGVPAAVHPLLAQLVLHPVVLVGIQHPPSPA